MLPYKSAIQLKANIWATCRGGEEWKQKEWHHLRQECEGENGWTCAHGWRQGNPLKAGAFRCRGKPSSLDTFSGKILMSDWSLWFFWLTFKLSIHSWYLSDVFFNSEQQFCFRSYETTTTASVGIWLVWDPSNNLKVSWPVFRAMIQTGTITTLNTNLVFSSDCRQILPPVLRPSGSCVLLRLRIETCCSHCWAHLWQICDLGLRK